MRGRLVPVHQEDLRSRPGVYKFGGPFFADNGAGEAAAQRAYGGSFFLMEAESYADALEVVQADVYYKEGLWDVLNVRLVEYTPLMGYPF